MIRSMRRAMHIPPHIIYRAIVPPRTPIITVSRRPFIVQGLNSILDKVFGKLDGAPKEEQPVPTDVGADYDLGKELGRGRYGIVYEAKDKKTGAIRAVKQIKKTAGFGGGVLSEIELVRSLDHPYIMKIEKYYENHAFVSIASERYDGKELFDQIVARGVYKEKDAALIVGQIVSAVSYLHDRNVVHRDIKPENILFKTTDPASDVVLIDFGTATYHFKHTDGPLDQEVGSPSYVAPEVLRRDYDKSCDMWSIGVVMYILLCGQAPFNADTDKEILKMVREGNYTMNQPEWNNISEDGKDLVRRMMTNDPAGRISAREALRHPWLLGQTVYKELPISDTNIIKNMRKFNSSRKLKQVALNVIASELSKREIESELRNIFKRLDANGDGIVTIDELKLAIAELDVDKKMLGEFSDAIDLSHTGTVDYEEFLAASMKQSDYLQDNILHDAFHFFDKDNDGFISPDELKVVIKKLLKHEPTDKEVMDMIDDADLDHDGKIAYKEFEAMMRDGNSTITKKILQNTSASNLGGGGTGPSSGTNKA